MPRRFSPSSELLVALWFIECLAKGEPLPITISLSRSDLELISLKNNCKQPEKYLQAENRHFPYFEGLTFTNQRDTFESENDSLNL